MGPPTLSGDVCAGLFQPGAHKAEIRNKAKSCLTETRRKLDVEGLQFQRVYATGVGLRPKDKEKMHSSDILKPFSCVIQQ
jgi:hypothetical protein